MPYTQLEVEKALDAFAHRFSFSIVGGDAESQPGGAVVISRGDEVLATGFINRARVGLGSREYSVHFEGRSATADLVDSSATHKSGTWMNKSALSIIADICEPFAIFVDTSQDPETLQAAAGDTFPRYSIEPGESAFASIDRLCKARGLLPTTRADGALLLVRKIKGLDVLAVTSKGQRYVERSIILSHERAYDDSDIHSEYSSSIHIAAPQDANTKASVEAVPSWKTTPRWRPLVVIPDAPLGPVALLNRLQWESNVRKGRSERFRFTVSGTGHNADESWLPGREYVLPDLLSQYRLLGKVSDNVDDPLPSSLLEKANIRVSSESATCDLEFVNPLAYSLESDTTVNVAGLTKSKTKPKLIVHRTKKRRQTK